MSFVAAEVVPRRDNKDGVVSGKQSGGEMSDGDMVKRVQVGETDDKEEEEKVSM